MIAVALSALGGGLIAFLVSSSIAPRYVARAMATIPAVNGLPATDERSYAQLQGPLARTERTLLTIRVAAALHLSTKDAAAALSTSSAAPTFRYGFNIADPATVDLQAIWPDAGGATAIAGTAWRLFAAMRDFAPAAMSQAQAPVLLSASGAPVVIDHSPRVGRDMVLGIVAAALLAFFAVTLLPRQRSDPDGDQREGRPVR